MSRRRWLTALITTFTMIVGAGGVSVITAAPAAADLPALTCSIAIAGDTCALSNQSATSLTVTYTSNIVNPVCTAVQVSENVESCTASMEVVAQLVGSGSPAPSVSTTCPWGTIDGGVSNSPILTPDVTTVTCTDSWSWTSAFRPGAGYLRAAETNGNGDGLSTGNHGFEVDYPAPGPPVASFTATPVAGTPGGYQFVSTSTDPLNETLACEWGSADGGSSTSGCTWNHTFAASGTYEVDLTVHDTDNRYKTTSQNIQVTIADLTASIALTGAGGAPFTGGASSVGQPLTATVTLSDISATNAITGITVSPPVSVTPSNLLTPISGPTPSPPTSLSAGQSASYAMIYTVASTGNATLEVDANGTEGSTALPTATATTVAHLGQPISVTVAWQQNGLDLSGAATGPNSIKLADNDTGEVPQDVTAVVTLKNTSVNQQDAISFNGAPVLSFHTSSHAGAVVPASVTAGPLPAGPIADLASQASTTLTYTVHVLSNGVFDFTAQVLSSDDGTNDTNVSQGVGTLTALPSALLWVEVAKAKGTAALTTAGDPIHLVGTVTNRSNTQSIDVDPIEPEIAGNGGGGGLQKADDKPLADGVILPFDGKLGPGESVVVNSDVATAPEAGTRATLTYKPSGSVVGSTGDETALTASQIGTATGTSPLELSMSDTDPTVPDSNLTSIIANFEASALNGAGQWAAGTLRAAADLLAHPIASGGAFVSGTAKVVVGTAVAAAQAAQIVNSMYVLSVAYVALTPEQRTAWSNQIVADFNASNINISHQALSRAADSVLPTFFNAVSTGDYNKVAQMAGSGVATGAGVAADLLLTDIVFQKLALGLKAGAAKASNGYLTNAIQLSAKLREAKFVAKLGKAIPGLLAGDNLLADGAKVLTDSYGMTQTQIRRLQAFCEHNKLIIAVRGRSKKAAELIRRGLAVGKNEVIKLKNVDSIDVKYLDYSTADLNTVVYAKPISQAEFDANIAGASEQEQALARQRYKQRLEEWDNADYRRQLNTWDTTGRIKLKFNGTDNGVPSADRYYYRDFALEQVKTHPRYYKRLMVGNKPGKGARLVKVTQDVDSVAVLAANNTILSPELRAQVYTYLADIIGIEHPETISWIKNGEILFETKAKLLADHLAGGEALAVFGPTGTVTAGFFNSALCIFNTATKGGTIIFDGGFNDPYAKAVTSLAVKLSGRS
jgi:hypothetical protein